MSEQEKFWSGSFGDQYIDRNQSIDWIKSNFYFFKYIFRNINNLNSMIEFGANIGLNIEAILKIYPKINVHAVEINKQASQILSDKKICSVSNCTINDYEPNKKYELSLVKGVLIHLNPEELPLAYKKIFESSSKYILIAEYYNPKPIAIDYRGHKNKLFKRDFAGEMMDIYKNLELVDYGFSYHKDKTAPQDDLTWFLLSKN
ncbi:hypothetical protein OBA27_01490 [Pelagibacteraceae bacterium]|nr:hypothetical protein [Pelagibacteraceae bacterium]